LEDYNVAPLLVRPISVPEPTGLLVVLLGLAGFVRLRHG